jgi:hypothetical protein
MPDVDNGGPSRVLAEVGGYEGDGHEDEALAADRRRVSRRREDGARWGTIERDNFREELSTTLVGQLREELAERDRLDRERRIREDAERDAKRVADEEAARKKKAADEAWDQKVREAEEQRKANEEKRKDRRQNAMMALIAALTATIGAVGAWFGTRPPPTPVERAAEVQKEAEQAKEQAVKSVVQATETDKAQNEKLRKLGLQAVEQVVLEVDTTDYTARMLKAVSSRAAREKEPPSFTAAKERAEKIRAHQEEARRLGKEYDPFGDLPEP